MNAHATTARTIEQISADLASIYATRQDLLAREEPLMLELLRAKVHKVVPDAAMVNLYADSWDNGWFYTADYEATATDGTVLAWQDVQDDPDAEGGLLDETFLADLSTLYGCSAVQPVLVVDLVHLSARTE